MLLLRLLCRAGQSEELCRECSGPGLHVFAWARCRMLQPRLQLMRFVRRCVLLLLVLLDLLVVVIWKGPVASLPQSCWLRIG